MLTKYVNLVLFLAMIVMNYLANSLPLNGKTTGELSAQYPNLFVPAGITFSIWGVIYLLLAAFVILQFRQKNKSIVNSIGWAFAISCLLNSLWIVAWHYELLLLSVGIMFGLLGALIYINQKLRNYPLGLIKGVFGIYLGWICIAAIANVTAALVYFNWEGFGISEEFWAVIMVTVGAIIAILAIARLNNPFIALSVIWAFIGILIKRQDDYLSIVLAATLGIGVLLMYFMIALYHAKSATKN